MAEDRRRPRPPRMWTTLVLLGLAAGLVVGLAACGGDAAPADDPGPLRLGLLVNLSEGAPARAVERQRAFELAVQHVNAAGGVFGQPVEFVVGDSTLDPEKAVAVARRLVEEEGVHALVGPTSSANALAVAEQVSGPAGIPTVSPSATSPALTLVNDGDFFFRTTLSDGAQGPVLARVAREQGFENVGVLYRNDPYGRGAVRVVSGLMDGRNSSCGRGRAANNRTCPSSAGPRRAGPPRWCCSPSRARGRSSCERPSTAAFTPALPSETRSRARTWYEALGATGWAACTAPPAHPTPTTPPPPRGTRPTPPSTERRPPSPTPGRPTTRPLPWPSRPKPPIAWTGPPSGTSCGPSGARRGTG